jgi:hypothetical protein
MTQRPLVRWVSIDPAGVRQRLSSVGIEAHRQPPRVGFPSAVLEFMLPDGSQIRSRSRDRLEFDPEGEAEQAHLQPDVVPGSDLVAIGWATVDLERAAAAWPDLSFAVAAEDRSLGARASVARLPGSLRLVLLEPLSEGRLAAFLARHGEGPSALYLKVPDALGRSPTVSGDRASAPVGGPFGPQAVLPGGGRDDPQILILFPAGRSACHGRRAGTIRP